MYIAWKEMKKSKVKFMILGSIIFLVSFLTFIISGLANGLSEDNASLIKDFPDGHFYMEAEANETYNLSRIDSDVQDQMLTKSNDAVALSIQMGFLNDSSEKQRSVAFVTSTDSTLFENVNEGEILLDSSLEEDIKIGDTLTNNQFSGEFIVKGFVNQKKYSHAPVAFINMENYKEIYRVNDMQLIFIPGQAEAEVFGGLDTFTNQQFLHTIPSYSAEQMSLNMIVWFLVVISGMLFAIFFYMMNVQKIGLYGILKAIGVKTSTLFKMMWIQMLVITVVSLGFSVLLSQGFNLIVTEMPFHLTIGKTIQLSVIFLIIGLIGATLSGIQIKKVEPLRAIQQGEM